MEALCNSDNHPCAKSVYECLKEQYPNLSLGTVYRNLAYFKEEGAIVSVGTVNGEERFDSNTMPHAHFICESCGNVYDIFDERLTTVCEMLDNDDFTVKRHSITLYGICKNCS